MRYNKYFILVISVFVAFSCQEESKGGKALKEVPEGANSSIVRMPVSGQEAVTKPEEAAGMTFEEELFDFGTVKEGDIVEHVFSFTNTGKVPLVISDARSTCGCTVPDWPKDPIEPGAKGQIKVKFDTDGKVERQNKPIMITANTYPAQNQIAIYGFVEAK